MDEGVSSGVVGVECVLYSLAGDGLLEEVDLLLLAFALLPAAAGVDVKRRPVAPHRRRRQLVQLIAVQRRSPTVVLGLGRWMNG